MNPKLISIALLFSALLFSCHKNVESSKDIAAVNDLILHEPAPLDKDKEQLQIPLGKPQQDTGAAIPQVSKPSPHVDWNKKIIKNATVKMEVKDFSKYNEFLHKVVPQSGGYISQEDQHTSNESFETVLSIKVPVEGFENLLNQLNIPDAKLLERKITSQDVTGEVVDTRSRVEAKRQARLKYLEFLKQAKNIDEVLKVQNDINDIQEQIESASGRIEYLSHESAYSTINLTFSQLVPGYKPVDTDPTFLARITNSFKLGAEWMANFIVALVAMWPLLLIIAGIIFIYKAKVAVKTNPQKQ